MGSPPGNRLLRHAALISIVDPPARDSRSDLHALVLAMKRSWCGSAWTRTNDLLRLVIPVAATACGLGSIGLLRALGHEPHLAAPVAPPARGVGAGVDGLVRSARAHGDARC